MQGNNRKPLQAMALMSAILSQLAGSILAGVFLGRWIDGFTGTSPLFLIIFLLLGLAGGVYATIQTVQRFYSGEE